MKSANITLAFNGNAEAAFNFYKSVFGGEFIHIQRMSDIPNATDLSQEEANKILHVALPIGHSVLAGMDVPASRPATTFGNNFMVTAAAESEEETKRIFEGLSAGANITIPLDHQFWGAYFGMLTDKFGIQWMVSYSKQP
ncbi:MAG: VOC family protein [Flavipsychrobacter sp.]